MSLRVRLICTKSRVTYRAPSNLSLTRRRYASATTQSPTPTSLKNFLKNFENSPIKHRAIHELYPAFAQGVQTATTVTPGPSKLPPHDSKSPIAPQINEILQTLASSGGAEDRRLIDQILLTMPQTFGLEPSLETHTIILRAYLQKKHFQVALQWLKDMSTKPPFLRPTLKLYHMLLEACSKAAISYKFLRNVVLGMEESGCTPTIETFKILTDYKFKSSIGPDNQAESIFRACLTLFEDMSTYKLRHNALFLKYLQDEFQNLGGDEYLEKVTEAYESHLPARLSPAEQRQLDWCTRLADASGEGGISNAAKLFGDYTASGGIVTEGVVNALLHNAKNVEDIVCVKEMTKTTPLLSAWSTVIDNNIRAGYVSNAVAVYEVAKKEHNIPPHISLVGPIIKFLTTKGIAKVDQALELYTEVYEASSNTWETGPNLDTYTFLMQGISRDRQSAKYLSAANELLDHMKARNIPVSKVVASIIIIQMKNATSDQKAFEAYRKSHIELDHSGYLKVLEAFCQLELGKKPTPSTDLYFEIAKDLRQRFPTDGIVYTIILQRLGTLADKALADDDISLDLIGALTKTIIRIHRILTVDAWLTPQPPIWNQLMDAYAKVFRFKELLMVWDGMYHAGQYDNKSLMMVFDTCGSSGSLTAAQDAYARLFKDKFKFSQGVWHSWLRCLCKLGEVGEATRIVCTGMDNNPCLACVQPDIESIRILVSHAPSTEARDQILLRVERHLPHVWSTLPDSIRQHPIVS